MTAVGPVIDEYKWMYVLRTGDYNSGTVALTAARVLEPYSYFGYEHGGNY